MSIPLPIAEVLPAPDLAAHAHRPNTLHRATIRRDVRSIAGTLARALRGVDVDEPAREFKIVCTCDSRRIRSQEPSGARRGISAQ